MEKYRSLQIVKEPLLFISFDDDNIKDVNESVLKELREIDLTLTVVAVIGPYRSGKSYLASRLLGERRGFSLGSSVQACTKGIWIWCRPHPVHKEQMLVIIDSEGLADPKKNNTTECDSRLFTLTILLCSTLIYNVKGTLDNDALEKLSFATTISERIKVNKDNTEKCNEEEMIHVFPEFILAIRDFGLDLEIDGEPITTDQYLDDCLAFTKSQKHDAAREWIRTRFTKRKCFALESPGLPRVLKKLEELPDEDLNKMFVEELTRLLAYVHNECEKMTILKGKPLNGPVYADLIVSYTEAMKTGHIPCISSAYELASKDENKRVLQKAVKEYEDFMKEKRKAPIPTVQDLSDYHHLAYVESVSIVSNGIIAYTDTTVSEFIKEFQTETDRLHTAIEETENARSAELCKQRLETLYQNINEKQKLNEYTKPGGYKSFQQDMEDVEQAYNTTEGMGFQKENELLTFKDNMSGMAEMIRQSDESLTETQKQFEKEKEELERVREQNRLAVKGIEEEKEKTRLKDIELKETTERFEADLKKQMEKQEKQLQLQMKVAIEEAKRAEREALEKKINSEQKPDTFMQYAGVAQTVLNMVDTAASIYGHVKGHGSNSKGQKVTGTSGTASKSGPSGKSRKTGLTKK